MLNRLTYLTVFHFAHLDRMRILRCHDAVLRGSFLHVEFNHLRSDPRVPQLVEPDVSQDRKKRKLGCEINDKGTIVGDYR